MELRLRDYCSADFETLYKIDQACYVRGIAYSRRMLRWYLSQRGSFCIVAQASAAGESQILGFIIAQAQREEGYVVTIDVLQKHRRAGVGTALLEEVERRLASMGACYVELQTATNNEAGVAFWLRHGYRHLGISRGYYLGRIDAYVMKKDLVRREMKAGSGPSEGI